MLSQSTHHVIDPGHRRYAQTSSLKPTLTIRFVLLASFVIRPTVNLFATHLSCQGEQFCLKYDANSLLYVSKAMDLFDLTLPALEQLGMHPRQSSSSRPSTSIPSQSASHSKSHPPPANQPPHLPELAKGLSPLASTPILILGVQSDILFPVEQQRELADALRMAGNPQVSYFELGGVWGHDTFL